MSKVDKTGRAKGKERFVSVPHYVMDTIAWSRLSVTARSAWLEYVRLHNGSNNGRIAMPERNLADRLGISRNTANRAIKELLTFGFVEITRGASTAGKRLAAEYLLTHLPDDRTTPKGAPSRAFQNVGKTTPSDALSGSKFERHQAQILSIIGPSGSQLRRKF